MVIQQKNRAIEMWRFIAALLILVYHFKRYDPDLGYVPFYGGYLGNIFFFVLGGFLLMQHFERNKYNKRIEEKRREEKRRSITNQKRLPHSIWVQDIFTYFRTTVFPGCLSQVSGFTVV